MEITATASAQAKILIKISNPGQGARNPASETFVYHILKLELNDEEEDKVFFLIKIRDARVYGYKENVSNFNSKL